MTIGRNIFSLDHLKDNGSHLSHEVMHVRQSDREPFIILSRYLFEFITKGYRNVSYEKEAYAEGDEYWYDHDICR